MLVSIAGQGRSSPAIGMPISSLLDPVLLETLDEWTHSSPFPAPPSIRNLQESIWHPYSPRRQKNNPIQLKPTDIINQSLIGVASWRRANFPK